MVTAGDPLVRYTIEGQSLILPISSDLPLILDVLPQYSTNIVRIVEGVHKAYPDLTIVDIGANIGDTVAMLRAKVRCPVLCIEGNDVFFGILKENVRDLGPEIFLENSFIGAESKETSGRVIAERGTARIEVTPGKSTVSFLALRDVLTRHPQFGQAKFIKIDTDGFDCQILQGNMELLAQLKPVVFFEYDPRLFSPLKKDGFEVFESLRGAGYTETLVYDNTGDYLLSARLEDQRLLKDVDQFYRGRLDRYCDICAFHREDEALVKQIRESEVNFFQQLRSRAS